jgi:hypothetical protein
VRTWNLKKKNVTKYRNSFLKSWCSLSISRSSFLLWNACVHTRENYWGTWIRSTSSTRFFKIRSNCILSSTCRSPNCSLVLSFRVLPVFVKIRSFCGDECEDGCLHHQGEHRPDDGGSKHLWNVVKLPGDTLQKPKRRPSWFVWCLLSRSKSVELLQTYWNERFHQTDYGSSRFRK